MNGYFSDNHDCGKALAEMALGPVEIRMRGAAAPHVFGFRPHDPLADDGASTPGEVDMWRSRGVMVRPDGRVVKAPAMRPEEITGEGRGVDTLPARPSFPAPSWALVRGALPGYNALPSELPSVSVKVRVPVVDADNLSDDMASLAHSDAIPRSQEWAEILSKLSRRIVEKYLSASREAGLFTSPFFAVAALRMADGSHTLASAPVLLTPSDVAPLLRLDSAGKGEFTHVFDFTIINAPCRLMVRWPRSLADEATLAAATHVDIFVSRQADFSPLADDAEGPAFRRLSECVMTRSGLSAQTNALNRLQPLTSADTPIPCLTYGRPGRGTIENALLACREFYKVAEMPLDALPSEWVEVPIGSLAGYEEGEPFIPDYSLLRSVSGGDVYRAGGHTLVVAPELCWPGAAPAAILTQHDDRLTGLSAADAMREAAWVFHPDPEADVLRVALDDGSVAVLPLRRHAFLFGSYWLPSHGFEVETASDAAPTPPRKALHTDIMLTSAPCHASLFSAACDMHTAGGEGIIGVAPALRSISSGQFGQFPLYLFTTSGIWVLAPSDSGGWRPVQPFSRLVCASSRVIATTRSGVAFATSRALWHIEGSKVTRLAPLRAGASPASRSFPPSDSPCASLAYDMVSNTLLLSLSSSRIICYDLDREAFVGTSSSSGDAFLLVTRPFAPSSLGTGSSRRSPFSLIIHGAPPGARLSLSGMEITDSHPRPLASTVGSSLRNLLHSPRSLLLISLASP